MLSMKEREIIINIEKCVDNMNQEVECPDVGDDKVGDLYSFKVCGIPMSVDVLGNGESLVKPSSGVSPDSGEKTKNGRRISMSAKKPPKPPRPPRGLSLDAADQKLIKEISELLMIKRARIERMKALKKTKAAKGGMSASTSSSGNFIAMFFTILFCIVIIFQGCHPWGIFPRNSSAVGIPISPKSDGATEGNIVALENKQNLSSYTVYMLSKVRSFNLLVPGSNNKPAGREAIR